MRSSGAYRRQTTGVPAVDQEFRRVEESLGQLGPLAGSLRLVEHTLASGNNEVRHGLGRVPIGRIVVYQSAASNLFDVSATSEVWTLNSSAACTVKLIFI